MRTVQHPWYTPDAGVVHNTATAEGTPPNPQDPPVLTPPAEETTPLPPAAGVELEKTGEVSGAAEAGDSITFRFTGTNTGNVTLSDVSISDELDGLGELSYNWPGVPGTLAPGERVTATALYTVTDEDAETGAVHNTATISGADPSGTSVDDDDSTTVTLGALAGTGISAPLGALVVGLLVTVLGALLLVLRGRQRRSIG